MPKQTDIDKILEIIRKKVLKGMHLPLTIKEIQAGYLNSSYFKDIYLYLAQNRLPFKKAAIKRVHIRLLSLFEYILVESGTAENKVEVLFSHDKLLLTSILRPLHQVTEEMLV